MTAQSKGQLLLEKLQERELRRVGKLSEYDQEKIRAEYYKANVMMIEQWLQRNTSQMSPEEVAKTRTGLTKIFQKNRDINLPTRFENPQIYWLMQELSQQVEEAAAALGRSIAFRPLIGTLPTRQVNALAIRVPASNEYLVLFESELCTFALLLSKVIARALPLKAEGGLSFSTAEDDWKKNIQGNPEIIRRFQEVVLAYILEGRPGAAPQYLVGPPYSTLFKILLDSMELFIIAHEYGHIIKGHLSTDQLTPISAGNEEGEQIIRNWQQELEADAQGLELMLYAMQRKEIDISLSYWGADLFFSCLEVVEQAVSIMRTGQEPSSSFSSDTHPPVQIRRHALRQLLENSLPEDIAKHPIQLGTILENIVGFLWLQTKPIFYRLHKEGMKLHPIWG